MPDSQRQFLLAGRPDGLIREDHFELTTAARPSAEAGGFVTRNLFWSVDPAMQGWMQDRTDYLPPIHIGDVMRASAVGEVVDSQNSDYAVGDIVAGTLGMQEYTLVPSPPPDLRKWSHDAPPQWALSIAGTTGLTAYFGMMEIGRPKPGETMLVSGAAGGVGSVAGQLGKIHGCRVVGIAGSDKKCAWLVEELGFDAAINYKTEEVKARVKELCPDGIDIYYDNVGGEILDIALARLRQNARIVLCGGISRYTRMDSIPGPKNYFNLIYRRARMEGFIVIDYVDRYDEGIAAMVKWADEGKLKAREDVLVGFENLPKALIRLFTGENVGKQLVKADI
ncbi:MAG: NADP-dependent oxidoreductase [Pseudomonadota bacterium]